MQQQNELLGFVHQGAKMGTETITELIKTTNDIPFRQVLENQLTQYQIIIDEVHTIYQKNGGQPPHIPACTSISSGATLKMNTLFDKTTSNLAGMIIQGSTMGVVEMTRHVNELPEADEQSKQLANKLIRTEQSNIDAMKQYI